MATFKYIDAINNQEFNQRVQYHMIKAAVAIANESAETANHLDRIALATRVLSANVTWATCVQLTLCNWVIEALPDPLTATDGNIYDAVSGFWDALSLTV